MTKVLYISYDGLTDALGQSQILPYIAGLAKDSDLEFTILSCEKPEKFRDGFDSISAICTRAGINWHPIFYTKIPPILSTLKDVYALRKHATKIQREKNIEIVHCRSYIPSLIGLYLKRRFGTKFIFDMRGFWADERVEGNLWRLTNPAHRAVYRFFKKSERRFLEQADAVVSLTDVAKQEMMTWGMPCIEEKTHVIPCCADLEHFNYLRFNSDMRMEIREELGIENDALLLTYLGSVGTCYLIEEMLQYFKQLHLARPSSRLLFITNDCPRLVKRKAAEIGVSVDTLVVTKSTRERVPEYLFASDVSYFFYKNSYSKIFRSPTKLAEILGMGKPAICNSGVGDIDSFFAAAHLGTVVELDNPESLQESIKGFDTLLRLDPARIRDEALSKFSLKNGVEAYQAIYNRLLAESSKDTRRMPL